MNAISTMLTRLTEWADRAESRANAMKRIDPSEAQDLLTEVSEARILACQIKIQVETLDCLNRQVLDAHSTLTGLISSASSFPYKDPQVEVPISQLITLVNSAKQFVVVD